MNTYLVYANGLLAGPNDFRVLPKNSAEHGKFLLVSVLADELKSKIKSIDVFEVRASNIVGRFRAESTDIEVGKMLQATCKRIENNF